MWVWYMCKQGATELDSENYENIKIDCINALHQAALGFVQTPDLVSVVDVGVGQCS